MLPSVLDLEVAKLEIRRLMGVLERQLANLPVDPCALDVDGLVPRASAGTTDAMVTPSTEMPATWASSGAARIARAGQLRSS